jgi:predicted dehydrogenase
MHLPYLRELGDRFEITALCDVTRDTLEAVGEQYHVPVQGRFTDYRELCTSDLVDAVLACPTGSHVPAAMAALRAGKHAIIEKPLTWRLDEAEEVVETAEEARRTSGALAMMAYTQLFDAGYQYGQRIVRPLANAGRVRYVDVRHIHPNNDLYMAHHTVFRGRDIDPAVIAAGQREEEQALTASVGSNAPHLQRRALFGMMGSSIHDVYCLNHLLGRPLEVLDSNVWDGGLCWNATLRYPEGVLLSYAWIDVRRVREFTREIACYADDRRVTITFPSPFWRAAPTIVRIQEMEANEPRPIGRDAGEPGWRLDGEAHTEKRVTASHEEAFKREWVHFHACMTAGVEPMVGAKEARDDTELIINWARSTRVL